MLKLLVETLNGKSKIVELSPNDDVYSWYFNNASSLKSAKLLKESIIEIETEFDIYDKCQFLDGKEWKTGIITGVDKIIKTPFKQSIDYVVRDYPKDNRGSFIVNEKNLKHLDWASEYDSE